VECDPALRADMDPDDFGEVLGNLLDNARKAARSRVRFTARDDGGGVRVAIVDDGQGVDEADAPVLMERGAQGGRGGEGSGLGLAIVRDILEEYGRAVTLRPEPGGGCRAEFEIPGHMAPAPAEPAHMPATAPRASAARPSPAPTNMKAPGQCFSRTAKSSAPMRAGVAPSTSASPATARAAATATSAWATWFTTAVPRRR
ncbi:ATP-binding protein, partial [Nostoc sp. NIES-2111]